MTGILDSLKLCLKGGFQSNKYYKISNITTPERCSFKMMRLMDYRPKDGLPASNMNNAASKKIIQMRMESFFNFKTPNKTMIFCNYRKTKVSNFLHYFQSTRIFAFSAPGFIQFHIIS